MQTDGVNQLSFTSSVPSCTSNTLKLGSNCTNDTVTGDLHIQKSGSHATLWLEADTDNTTEDDHPKVYLTQDGGGVGALIGVEGSGTGSDETNGLNMKVWDDTGTNATIRFFTGGITAASNKTPGILASLSTPATERMSISPRV